MSLNQPGLQSETLRTVCFTSKVGVYGFNKNRVCVHGSAMALVWRSEDSFAGVSSSALFYLNRVSLAVAASLQSQLAGPQPSVHAPLLSAPLVLQ